MGGRKAVSISTATVHVSIQRSLSASPGSIETMRRQLAHSGSHEACPARDFVDGDFGLQSLFSSDRTAARSRRHLLPIVVVVAVVVHDSRKVDHNKLLALQESLPVMSVDHSGALAARD
ncbi:hypothetical protein RB213_013954 [Colletotrichum asianum]